MNSNIDNIDLKSALHLQGKKARMIIDDYQR